MKITRATSFLTALCVAAILSGCGSTGVGDILGGGRDTGSTSDRSNDPYNDRYGTAADVRGTVERVDTRDRVIVVDSEGTDSRYNLRNGNGGEVVLYYDDRTTVHFQGQTYRPEDLERGDRIDADVEQSGSRLMAQQIDVLYDVTGGATSSNSGGYNDGYNDRNDSYNDDLGRDQELRGVVRSIDTRDRTMRIEERSRFGSSTGRGDIVTVYYDAGTTVEYEGRNYKPENLEQGDLVEVELRRVGGRLMAQEVLVVGEDQSITR